MDPEAYELPFGMFRGSTLGHLLTFEQGCKYLGWLRRQPWVKDELRAALEALKASRGPLAAKLAPTPDGDPEPILGHYSQAREILLDVGGAPERFSELDLFRVGVRMSDNRNAHVRQKDRDIMAALVALFLRRRREQNAPGPDTRPEPGAPERQRTATQTQPPTTVEGLRADSSTTPPGIRQ